MTRESILSKTPNMQEHPRWFNKSPPKALFASLEWKEGEDFEEKK